VHSRFIFLQIVVDVLKHPRGCYDRNMFVVIQQNHNTIFTLYSTKLFYINTKLVSDNNRKRNTFNAFKTHLKGILLSIPPTESLH